MTGADLVKFLQTWAWDSFTGVSALMGVTPERVLTWENMSMEELRKAPKGVRLLRLHRTVKFASDYGIQANQMLGFLHEPVDGTDEGASVLFLAVYQSGDLAGPLMKVIERFKESSK